jgi:hypothetical protein
MALIGISCLPGGLRTMGKNFNVSTVGNVAGVSVKPAEGHSSVRRHAFGRKPNCVLNLEAGWPASLTGLLVTEVFHPCLNLMSG